MPYLIAALLLGVLAVVAWIWRGPRRVGGKLRLALGVAAIGCVLLVAWRWSTPASRTPPVDPGIAAKIPQPRRSDGYVGSDACRSCHAGPHASWHASYHRTMTTVAGTNTVQAPFDGRRLSYQGSTYQVEQRGNEFWVKGPPLRAGTTNPAGEASLVAESQRVSLITGSHHMQFFWVAPQEDRLQFPFPFAWLKEEQAWVPARETFLRDPAKGHPLQHWNNNCISCHATAGQPRAEGAPPRYDTRTAELGIACEACHGPGEAHVAHQQNLWTRYVSRFLPGAARSDTTIRNPADMEKTASAHACGQCHGIRWVPASENFNANGYSFRPGDILDQSTPVVRPSRLDLQPVLREPLRRAPSFLDEHYWSDGEVRVSGREFNGLVDSPCFERGSMTCLSCHSMHRYADRDDQLRRGMETNEACLQCHPKYRETLETHTHHRADSSGSLCYNCHMPHTTYGLLKAIRSHRITSPSVALSMATGRPNACNLCHLDRSLGWTADRLQAWYRQPVPALGPAAHQRSSAALLALAGDAGQRALIAWHMGWAPARAVSGERWLAPFLAQGMADPYSAVRFIAYRSLRRLPGFENLAFDFVADEPTRMVALGKTYEIWSRSGKQPDRTGPEVFLLPDGSPDAAAIERVLRERNDRSIDLQE